MEELRLEAVRLALEQQAAEVNAELAVAAAFADAAGTVADRAVLLTSGAGAAGATSTHVECTADTSHMVHAEGIGDGKCLDRVLITILLNV